MAKKKSVKKKRASKKEVMKQIDDFIMALPPEYLDELIDRTNNLLDESVNKSNRDIDDDDD